MLFLKGLAIGQPAFGNAFVKMSWDIDVMVAPDVVGRADWIEALNYRCVTAAVDCAALNGGTSRTRNRCGRATTGWATSSFILG